jgi:hypothetical protein
MNPIQYSYESVPTIKRFALSDKRIRGLMGPFGSGKSSGCLWEIIWRAHKQAPGRDGIRRTRWAVIRNTYPQLKDSQGVKPQSRFTMQHAKSSCNSLEHTEDY